MRSQPNRDYVSNDVIMTPYPLALKIVEYFNIHGSILEPCKGSGNFLKAISDTCHESKVDWCEISEGRDFYHYEKKTDWIITNPPWSQINPFLYQSMRFANDVVFLMTINHAFTKARMKDVQDMGFRIADILLIDEWPKGWPKSGFSLGAVHWTKDQSINICNIVRI